MGSMVLGALWSLLNTISQADFVSQPVNEADKLDK